MLRLFPVCWGIETKVGTRETPGERRRKKRGTDGKFLIVSSILTFGAFSCENGAEQINLPGLY